MRKRSLKDKNKRRQDEIVRFLKDRNESTNVIVMSRLLLDVIAAHTPNRKWHIFETISKECEAMLAEYENGGPPVNRSLKIKGLPVLISIVVYATRVSGNFRQAHPTISVNVESTSSMVMSLTDFKKSIVDDAISSMFDETK
jgi:hypothetical protein